jgi:hypothetical protein
MLLGFLPSLLIDRRLGGAAALEKKCGAEEKQQGDFHGSKIARACADAKAAARSEGYESPFANECYSDIFGPLAGVFRCPVQLASVQ